MATDTPIAKRLIISGLTPAITVDDISRRLSTFGTVKAVDGFGLPDGLGQPRKFGYVTLETTTSKLARCMNLLSGSTWKGAKLRFGEAKPDYKERITLENERAAEEPPRKRRRRFRARVYTEDMSLVTPENAEKRPGWKVSSLGRITKPARMRPLHPLPDVQEEAARTKAASETTKKPEDGKERKKKKRLKDPDARARRKTIDMAKWSSTHLKGVFLDLEVGPTYAEAHEVPPLELSTDGRSESDEEGMEVEAALQKSSSKSLSPWISTNSLAGPSAYASAPTEEESTLASAPLSTSLPDNNMDTQLEKEHTLNLLASLFGDKDEDDWVGRESVGSDIDVDELVKGDVLLAQEDDEFEVVPKSHDGISKAKAAVNRLEEEDKEEELEGSESGEDQDDEMVVDAPAPRAQAKPSGSSKLKDLFAPREEEAGFSLLGHLDLDIEFDEDLHFLADQHLQNSSTNEPAVPSYAPTSSPITLQTPSSHAPLMLNPRQPLFFPLPRNPNLLNKARQRDLYDLAKEGGWFWRDASVGFFKTENEEEVRKRWEEGKGELTREWKRRWREAGKVRRRKKGVDGGDE